MTMMVMAPISSISSSLSLREKEDAMLMPVEGVCPFQNTEHPQLGSSRNTFGDHQPCVSLEMLSDHANPNNEC
jgi:hypothetical protein